MNDTIKLEYTVSGEDFTRAGEASSDLKNMLKQLGVSPDVVRKVSIAMYEGEINMVIHANGGIITVYISPTEVTMILKDSGPVYLILTRPCRPATRQLLTISAPLDSVPAWDCLI